MTGVPYPWILIGLAAAVDVVGLFYLWRRRNAEMGPGHRDFRGSGRPLRIQPAERRRTERRKIGKAAAMR